MGCRSEPGYDQEEETGNCRMVDSQMLFDELGKLWRKPHPRGHRKSKSRQGRQTDQRSYGKGNNSAN